MFIKENEVYLFTENEDSLQCVVFVFLCVHDYSHRELSELLYEYLEFLLILPPMFSFFSLDLWPRNL